MTNGAGHQAALVEAEVAVGTARGAEQAASQTAAQEAHRRHLVQQQLAGLQQTLQQVWLVLLSVCIFSFAYMLSILYPVVSSRKEHSAYAPACACPQTLRVRDLSSCR